MSASHESGELERYERALADALTAADPRAVLDALPAGQRARFADFDLDGLGITALIVARLRFERLLHGSAGARDAFDRDPRAFTATFKRYHRGVPPVTSFPSEEARAFERWLSAEEASRPPR